LISHKKLAKDKETIMSEKYSFIVVKYPQRDTAEAALRAVLGLAKEKVVKLRDAVAITKTEKGKIKLHQTKDDPATKGLLKGGLIGVIFAVLLGGAPWIVAGAAAGTAFALFDRGIKNKLLKELGEGMSADQSALAVLIKEADWGELRERMAAENFGGEAIVHEMTDEHLAEVEKLAGDSEKAEAVPEEMEVPEAE
jgi:uncharacterized membrane protein